LAVSYLDRIRACNTHDLARYRPLNVGRTRVGWVRADFAAELARHPDVFHVTDDRVTLAPSLDDFEARSTAVARTLGALKADGRLPGWRGELYPVKTAFASAPLFQMERAAVPRLGIRAYGVHMNGFVRTPDGLKMWVARRSRTKPTFPGMLDNMVAGGQPIGLSLYENLVKECGEEAGIPPALARRATAVGAVSYVAEVDEGLKPDVQFCFDLELPADFTPRPVDGEIESFVLLPIAEVARLVAQTSEFKFNCNLVVIDFLVRHGVIPPDDPDYLAIVAGLRQGAPL
jgi:8-oxo-dGTP pyrophosphatase MutT (NUDIX family)